MAQPITVVEAFFNTGAFWFSFFAIFPLITMRLYAEEFRLGTYELLQTAPVRDWQIVFAKFTGAYVFFLTLWLPTALYFPLYSWIAHEQAAPALGNYYGTYPVARHNGRVPRFDWLSRFRAHPKSNCRGHHQFRGHRGDFQFQHPRIRRAKFESCPFVGCCLIFRASSTCMNSTGE